MGGRIRIGTRGSRLAMWQANEVSRLLQDAGLVPEIVVIRTSGDKRQDVALASIGGKGLFIKELEEALERREIDMAVHSLKDVPSVIPSQFALAGFLERADPRDAWVHPNGTGIRELPSGSVVGTSSPRRRAQLLSRFPHLSIESIRGNVETRIGKARDGQYAGIVLAAAGLGRLELQAEVTSFFSVDEMVPAAGQGIVGIETLASDPKTRDAAAAITNEASVLAARCERGVLESFGETLDCYSAVAVHAIRDGGEITLRAFAGDLEGIRSVHVRRSGTNAAELIAAVYSEMIARGAMELVCA